MLETPTIPIDAPTINAAPQVTPSPVLHEQDATIVAFASDQDMDALVSRRTGMSGSDRTLVDLRLH